MLADIGDGLLHQPVQKRLLNHRILRQPSVCDFVLESNFEPGSDGTTPQAIFYRRSKPEMLENGWAQAVHHLAYLLHGTIEQRFDGVSLHSGMIGSERFQHLPAGLQVVEHLIVKIRSKHTPLDLILLDKKQPCILQLFIS